MSEQKPRLDTLSSEVDKMDKRAFEQVASESGLEEDIRINKLTKVWNASKWCSSSQQQTAVDRLSFSAYRGQVMQTTVTFKLCFHNVSAKNRLFG